MFVLGSVSQLSGIQGRDAAVCTVDMETDATTDVIYRQIGLECDLLRL